MAASSDLKSTRPRLGVCVLINLFAFPGMGTVMAGRRSGYIQALLMVAGFCLVVGFMIWFFICATRYLLGAPWTQEEYRAQYQPFAWTWQLGLVLCLVSWVWALISSLLMLKQMGVQEENQDPGSAHAPSSPLPLPPPEER